MTSKPAKEYGRWAMIISAGGTGLYSLFLLGYTLVQISSASSPTVTLAFVLIGVLLVSLPLLLIAHGFLVRQYEVAVNLSAALAAVFVFCFLMSLEHQLHLLKWAEQLDGLGDGGHPNAGWRFVGTFGGFALAVIVLFLPIICAQKLYRSCRKMGYRWFGLPTASAERHAA